MHFPSAFAVVLSLHPMKTFRQSASPEHVSFALPQPCVDPLLLEDEELLEELELLDAPLDELELVPFPQALATWHDEALFTHDLICAVHCPHACAQLGGVWPQTLWMWPQSVSHDTSAVPLLVPPSDDDEPEELELHAYAPRVNRPRATTIARENFMARAHANEPPTSNPPTSHAAFGEP
jgi:hypothetical protein